MAYVKFMAILANHLLLYLFLFITLLSNFIYGNTIEPPKSYCPSFSCGDRLVLGYPFWQLEGQRLGRCGYPSFGISCSNYTPMLQLSDHSYRVKNLNFSEHTLTIAYSDVNDTICPVASHGVALNSTSTFLNFTKEDEMLHFFYNCTLYPPSVEKIKCLQLGAKHSYVFHEGLIPQFDWKGNCDSIVSVPVMQKGRDGLLARTFGRALQEGFKLKWQQPDNICQSCEFSGGFCGYGDSNMNKFSHCFCKDGTHSTNCHDAVARVSAKLEPNFLLIATLIFGGILIISMIIYGLRIRRAGSQKQGFSQIPSSGK